MANFYQRDRSPTAAQLAEKSRTELTPDDIEKLCRLAAQDDVLLSLVRAHGALLIAGHVVKWLSAFVALFLMMKGILS